MLMSEQNRTIKSNPVVTSVSTGVEKLDGRQLMHVKRAEASSQFRYFTIVKIEI